MKLERISFRNPTGLAKSVNDAVYSLIVGFQEGEITHEDLNLYLKLFESKGNDLKYYRTYLGVNYGERVVGLDTNEF